MLLFTTFCIDVVMLTYFYGGFFLKLEMMKGNFVQSSCTGTLYFSTMVFMSTGLKYRHRIIPIIKLFVRSYLKYTFVLFIIHRFTCAMEILIKHVKK